MTMAPKGPLTCPSGILSPGGEEIVAPSPATLPSALGEKVAEGRMRGPLPNSASDKVHAP